MKRNLPNMLRLAIVPAALWFAGHGRADLGTRKAMSAQEVKQTLGPPGRIARQVLYRRHIEQWVYENPQPGRLALNCVRGEDACVIGELPVPVTLP